MISGGVFFGALMPYQALASYPGRKSATSGKSGSTSERTVLVTARPRSLPDLTCSAQVGMLSNITCIVPDSMSVSAGAPPRYGTCCMLIPVSILNNSPDMWIVEPLPDDAMLSLPGLALAYAINSG